MKCFTGHLSYFTWALGINDHRNLGIRINGDKFGSVGLVLGDVDRMRLVRKAHFFQRYSDLQQGFTLNQQL